MIEQYQLQLLSQIVETMDQIARKMESAASKGNKEEYEKAKNEILKFQEKASEILKK